LNAVASVWIIRTAKCQVISLMVFFMNVELNNKIWVSEVDEKEVQKVLGTRRSLNCYEGHPYGRLHVESNYTVSILFSYIINFVFIAVSKMLCTLINHKIPEHTTHCIFVLYCTRRGMLCTVGYCWFLCYWYWTRQGVCRLGICFNIICSEIFSLN
jgi:hypothetical protein